jgi:hypothetical protein
MRPSLNAESLDDVRSAKRDSLLNPAKVIKSEVPARVAPKLRRLYI